MNIESNRPIATYRATPDDESGYRPQSHVSDDAIAFSMTRTRRAIVRIPSLIDEVLGQDINATRAIHGIMSSHAWMRATDLLDQYLPCAVQTHDAIADEFSAVIDVVKEHLEYYAEPVIEKMYEIRNGLRD